LLNPGEVFLFNATKVPRQADNWLPVVGDFFAVWRAMRDLASTDRRRVPRAVIADTELSVLAFPIPVRLLDISLGGVLLESSHSVELGTRGTLRFNFGGVPFSADVKVERLESQRSGAGERFSIGASFVALSRQDQRVIERFADQ
jgi:hypothetical protein